MGLKQAGFKELASIDSNQEAVAVFRANLPEVPYVLERDLTTYKPHQLASLINTDHVDLVVGGPPCQGFSKVRQVDGANSGKRLVDDNRRHLYKEFLEYVKFFRPKIFIMENVPGIRTTAGGMFFSRVQSEARQLGYRVHGEMIRAWEYGVPQKRQRQLIMGTPVDLPLFSGHIYVTPTHTLNNNLDASMMLEKVVTLWEAIGDLPPVHAGDGREIRDYDLGRRQRQLEKYGDRYLFDVLNVQKAENLTAHRARPHSARDLRDFIRLREGENSAQAIARGENMEFPYDREVFKDRYTRQHKDELCSTIVAHLSKDGLMFIHPSQNRSLTPREAARIQSFPDWFEFPVFRIHQYRLIGNAVPPLVGKAIGRGINNWLDSMGSSGRTPIQDIVPIDESQAISWLMDIDPIASNRNLSKLPKDRFKRAWFAIAYLYGHLHPDSARENSTLSTNHTNAQFFLMEERIPHLIRPVYSQSGWPEKLVPMAIEAQRRFENGELKLDEYYFSDVQIAGLKRARKQGG